MPSLQGKTDQEEVFQLDSALVDARWLENEGFVHGKATVEIRTFNVGDGASVKITLRNREGGSLGEFTGQVIAGLHRRLLPLAPEAKGGVFFEVALPDHGLSAIGPKLPVGPPVILDEPSWKDSETGQAVTTLKRGMNLELRCSAPCLPADKPATFAIYCRVGERAEKLLARLPAKVEAESLAADWVFDYSPATLELSAASELQPTGESYAGPTLLLAAECLGIVSRNAWIPFQDHQTIRVVDADGVPMPGQKVKLYMPDGSTREVAADGEGSVQIHDAPPGKIRVEWVETGS